MLVFVQELTINIILSLKLSLCVYLIINSDLYTVDYINKTCSTTYVGVESGDRGLCPHFQKIHISLPKFHLAMYLDALYIVLSSKNVFNKCSSWLLLAEYDVHYS